MIQDKTRCKLILDSCCDLPRRILDQAGVEFLRFPFIMNDGEHSDDLWQNMPSGEFYNRMRNGEVVGTAQVSVPVMTETFERLAVAGIPAVYLSLSSALSGSFETASRIADDIHERYPDFELYVVDTKLASVGEGLLGYEAIRQRDRGLTAKQLAEWAQEARWYVHGYFTVDQLEYLRRGGRVPDMAAYAGSKLDIKPLLTFDLDGSLAFHGVVRGRKKALKGLDKIYKERSIGSNESGEAVLIGSADDTAAADLVEKILNRSERSLPAIRCDIGPVIGSHVGPGMVAIVFWGPDRRENISIADKIADRIR